LHLGNERLEIILTFDLEGDFDRKGVWWMGLHSSDAGYEVVQLLIASGFQISWGPLNFSRIYVRRGLSPTPSFREIAQQILEWPPEGSPEKGEAGHVNRVRLVKGPVSIRVFTGPAVEPLTGLDRSYAAISYKCSTFHRLAQRTLVGDIDSFLVREGYTRMTRIKCRYPRAFS
jgi:hypothetical protein